MNGDLGLHGGAAAASFARVRVSKSWVPCGVGDLIQSITKFLGIPSCAGCARRAAALNRVVIVVPRSQPMLSDAAGGDSIAPVPGEVLVIPSLDDHGCKVVANIIWDNTCTAGNCPKGFVCGWTRVKIKYWPRFFLNSSDSYRLIWPRDFEPTECGCIDVQPRLSAPPEHGAAHQPTHDDHGHQPHRPEDEISPQERIMEEELERLKEGWDIELWRGPGD